MSNRKRPWWMLSWPSWVALVVFGGAFVLLNVTVRLNPKHNQLREDSLAAELDFPEFVVGWPAVWADVEYDVSVVPRDMEWSWTSPYPLGPYLDADVLPRPTISNRHALVLADIFIAVV